MTAGLIHNPGDQRGPCEGTCEHRNCALLRQDAENACALCGQPIGYAVPFYRSGDGKGLAHAECSEREL